jgi:hypothetical protein
MMPPMARLMALIAALALLGAFLVFAYAGFRKYRRRPISPATVRLGVALLGAGHSFGLLYVSEPVVLVSFLVLPAVATYWLLRRGLRVAGGLLLIALGLPTGLWWGFFVAQDAIDPLPLYDPILWLWWAPAVALVTVGSILVTRGDRPAPGPQLFERAATHVRDPAALGNALVRSIMIGPIPMPMVIGLVAAMVGVGVGIPLAVQAGVPWLAALLAGTLLFAVVSVELGFVTTPMRVGAAMQGFAVVGSPEVKRWVAATGTRVPTSVRAIRTWLEENPDRPETRWARAQALIIVGDLADARTAIEGMPIPTAWDRFEQLALRGYLEWVEGHDQDLEALRTEADAIGERGSPQRLAARGMAMVAQARDLVVSGGDWMAPLIALRDEAGPVAGRMLRADKRRGLYPVVLAVGFIICAATLLLSGFLG